MVLFPVDFHLNLLLYIIHAIPMKTLRERVHSSGKVRGTVGASSSVTRRVLAEIVTMIYHEVWAVLILEYK